MSADFDLVLRTAFPAEYPRLVSAVQVHPNPAELAKIFVDLAGHVNTTTNGETSNPASKKRKLDDGATTTVKTENGTVSHGIANPIVAFECKDVSFQIPTRKKLKLQIVSDGADHSKEEIRLRHPQSDDLEHALRADQIDQVFLFPIPEKQQRQWNFCIFPKSGGTDGDATCEQIAFALNETAPAGAILQDHATAEDDTYVTVTEIAMNRVLQKFGKRVVRPDDAEFASSIPQAHRKGEKAYHVKAHRGSKEGYLFFVENGVVFGFKKPLAFFPFSAIESVSYTSVLQRTFNLVITTRDGDGDEVKEIEFSMLDQADFAGIDEYIKRHELNDASMAADRRAKAYNVNKEKDKKDDVNGGAAGEEDDGRTELEKAEQQLQDEEDEEEEDYEASGGESDGEGDDSDEEEEEYGNGGEGEIEEDEDEGGDE